MKCKPDVTAAFFFQMLELIHGFFLAFFLIFLFHRVSVSEYLGLLAAYGQVLLVLAAGCGLVFVVSRGWIEEPNLTLTGEGFFRGPYEAKYEEITRLELDVGAPRGRFSPPDPCCLDCYVGQELRISIDRPSPLLILILRFLCRNAKFRLARIARSLVLLILIPLFALLEIFFQFIG